MAFSAYNFCRLWKNCFYHNISPETPISHDLQKHNEHQAIKLTAGLLIKQCYFYPQKKKSTSVQQHNTTPHLQWLVQRLKQIICKQ